MPGRRCDVEARNRVVQENLGLVREVARQFANRGMSLEDLIGEGNLGLIRAAQEYDPNLGARFSTYAYYWIRDAITTALASSVRTIRLPMHVSRLLLRWRQTERRLQQTQGRTPTFEEVAAAMGLDRPTQRLVAQAHRAAGIANAAARADVSLRSILLPDHVANVEETMTESEERELVGRRLERLDATERSVVMLRYGLAGDPPMSFDQIGRQIGIPPSAVQRSVTSAMRKLAAHPLTPVAARRPAYDCLVG